MKTNMQKWIIMGITLFIILYAFAATSFGMTFHKDEDIVIGEGEVVEGDLFLIGKTVAFRGKVTGDLFVAAKDVAIDGHVEESAFIAGDHVVISGTVEDDAHIAAQLLEIKGYVEEDLFFIGSESHVWQSAAVDGDYIFAGGVVMTHGPVSGYLVGAGKQIYLDGEIGGSVTIAVKELMLSKRARIAGDLRYVSEEAGRLHEESVVRGEVTFKHAEADGTLDSFFPLVLITGVIGKVLGYFMLLVTGLVFIIFTPAWLKRLTASIARNPGRCAGWGAVAVFAAPAGIAIAFSTVVGAGLAGLAFSLYLAAMYISQIIAGLFIGNLVLRHKDKEQSKGLMFGTLALGLLIVQAVRLIPVVGALVWVAAGIFGFGAMVVSERKRP
jgi:cytoskeletal protein CcmA (bactofilin family)